MNALQLYSGRPLKLAENVYVEHPKVNKLFSDVGEKDVYSEYMKNLTLIITQSKDIADILWVENKIWYEDIKSEYDFFIQECLSDSTSNSVFIRDGELVSEMDEECIVINNDMSNALNYFLNLDGKWIVLGRTIGENTQIFLLSVKCENDKLYIESDSVKFNEQTYHILVEYLRDINWLHPKYEFLKGATKKAKKVILQRSYEEREYEARKNKSRDKEQEDFQCILSCLVTFKIFSYEELFSKPIYVIYDSYFRYIQADNYRNTMDALHSGCIDTKKNPIDINKIHWSSIINNES